MTVPGPFPPTLRTLVLDSTPLKLALTAAQATIAATSPGTGTQNAPISIVEVVDNQTFNYAGSNDTGMFFSGSLLKVAAMLGAFSLKQRVNDVAAVTPFAAAGTLFPTVKSTFDPFITTAVKLLQTTFTQPADPLLPKYTQIFAPPTPRGSGFFATCQTTFSSSFLAALTDMIVISSDPQAATTISTLGHGITMGTLKSLGFFDDTVAAKPTGVWLGGTYAGGGKVARVPSLNDGPSAQATNTRQMARLIAQLIQATDLDATSTGGTAICNDMMSLLEKAQGALPSTFSTNGAGDLGPTFKPRNTKIGIGGLGPTSMGGAIQSEATVIRHLPTTRRFIVVYQNVSNDPAHKRPLGAMVKQTIESYLLATIGFIPTP